MKLSSILLSLAVSLALTIVLEDLTALIWRLKREERAVALLANIITNPLVVFLYICLVSVNGVNRFAVTCVLESGAFITEALIYKRCCEMRYPLLFSLTANAVSFSTGLIISSLMHF